MSRRIQELTGLRCIAVMLVVVAHAEHMIAGGYTGWLTPLKLFANGSLGVLIFFVLSGFLITDLLQAEWKTSGTIRFMPFYMRRALRIWPAFYAYLVTIGGLAACGVIDVGYRQIGYAAFHLWNYSEWLGLGPTNTVHPNGVWYLGHFWTLALEEQFYWFWPPLLLVILRRGDTRLLMFLILFVPLVRMGSYFATPFLRGQLEMMLHTGVDPVLMGCYVALNKERLISILDSRSNRSLVLTILVAVLFFVIPMIERKPGGYWIASYGRTVESAIAGIIIAALNVKRDFWLARILHMRIFVFVGTISFSLYLWQQLFLDTSSPVAFRFPLCVVAPFAAAVLSYGLIELPFLRIKDKLGGSKRRRKIEEEAGGTEIGMGVTTVKAGD